MTFDRTGVKGTIPSELGRLTQMCKFAKWAVPAFQSTDGIDDEIGTLFFDASHALLCLPVLSPVLYTSRSVDISFHRNSLSGPLPTDLGRLNLSIFRLYKNNLTGAIPSELGEMSGMSESNNR